MPRSLQTALSDTNGAARGASFETWLGIDPPEAIGVLSSTLGGEKDVPVFSGEGIAADLSRIPFKDVHIWVWAHSVFSKVPILRQARTSELLAVWDYEGKLESRVWSRPEGEKILRARLSSPPAKMLRCFAQTFCDAILQKLQGGPITSQQDKAPDGLKGLTRDIPFSALEEKATTRIVTAQADFAEVDLSAWSLPSETDKEAKARVVLRRFACRWWVRNLEREAMRWWAVCLSRCLSQRRVTTSGLHSTSKHVREVQARGYRCWSNVQQLSDSPFRATCFGGTRYKYSTGA
jgi:hypothetical protein